MNPNRPTTTNTTAMIRTDTIPTSAAYVSSSSSSSSISYPFYHSRPEQDLSTQHVPTHGSPEDPPPLREPPNPIPYISIAGRKKRRRTTVEDAFRSLTLVCRDTGRGQGEEENAKLPPHEGEEEEEEKNEEEEEEEDDGPKKDFVPIHKMPHAYHSYDYFQPVPVPTSSSSLAHATNVINLQNHVQGKQQQQQQQPYTIWNHNMEKRKDSTTTEKEEEDGPFLLRSKLSNLPFFKDEQEEEDEEENENQNKKSLAKSQNTNHPSQIHPPSMLHSIFHWNQDSMNAKSMIHSKMHQKEHEIHDYHVESKVKKKKRKNHRMKMSPSFPITNQVHSNKVQKQHEEENEENENHSVSSMVSLDSSVDTSASSSKSSSSSSSSSSCASSGSSTSSSYRSAPKTYSHQSPPPTPVSENKKKKKKDLFTMLQPTSTACHDNHTTEYDSLSLDPSFTSTSPSRFKPEQEQENKHERKQEVSWNQPSSLTFAPRKLTFSTMQSRYTQQDHEKNEYEKEDMEKMEFLRTRRGKDSSPDGNLFTSVLWRKKEGQRMNQYDPLQQVIQKEQETTLLQVPNQDQENEDVESMEPVEEEDDEKSIMTCSSSSLSSSSRVSTSAHQQIDSEDENETQHPQQKQTIPLSIVNPLLSILDPKKTNLKRMDPIDMKIEDLIRRSRLQAYLQQTHKNEETKRDGNDMDYQSQKDSDEDDTVSEKKRLESFQNRFYSIPKDSAQATKQQEPFSFSREQYTLDVLQRQQRLEKQSDLGDFDMDDDSALHQDDIFGTTVQKSFVLRRKNSKNQ